MVSTSISVMFYFIKLSRFWVPEQTQRSSVAESGRAGNQSRCPAGGWKVEHSIFILSLKKIKATFYKAWLLGGIWFCPYLLGCLPGSSCCAERMQARDSTSICWKANVRKCRSRSRISRRATCRIGRMLGGGCMCWKHAWIVIRASKIWPRQVRQLKF